MKICLSIAAWDDAFREMREQLERVAEVEVVGLDGYSLKGTDIFIGKKMSAATLMSADSLKAVFAYKTGVDDFPLRAFRERGILLINSHVNSGYIAEYAFALSLALVTRVAQFDKAMRRGDWMTADPNWRSLLSMKVGLAGYGSIGRAIDRLLRMNKISTYTIDRGKEYEGVNKVASLEELCRTCDLIIASLPSTKETDGVFSREILQSMRGKFLVNVGRSNCIDEAALYSALKDGVLAGAAIDTWRQKPAAGQKDFYPYDFPFHELDNVLLSSHKAMQIADGHEKYVKDTLYSVLRYLNGEPLSSVVDLTKGY